ncbi:MAG: Uma2 family endonuclease [Planctomycetaceae bacterium]
MATVLDPAPDRTTPVTLTALASRFGPMPLARIRTDTPPGAATEADVLRVLRRDGRLCELIGGVLLQKDVGYEESLLAGWLITFLNNFVGARRLGFVAGEAGMLRLAPGLVLIPDVSFIARDRLPAGKLPRQPIPSLVPNLAIEILSRGNTREEMRRKVRHYFEAGVELVWIVDANRQTIQVFTSPQQSVVLKSTQTLTGGKVLPGFKLKIRELFAKLEQG